VVTRAGSRRRHYGRKVASGIGFGTLLGALRHPARVGRDGGGAGRGSARRFGGGGAASCGTRL